MSGVLPNLSQRPPVGPLATFGLCMSFQALPQHLTVGSLTSSEFSLLFSLYDTLTQNQPLHGLGCVD